MINVLIKYEVDTLFGREKPFYVARSLTIMQDIS